MKLSAPMKQEEFRRTRARLGFRQEDLANEMGVHRVTVAKWETGALEIPKAVGWLLRLLDRARTSTRKTLRS
jgi:DNA-binding transcriptional regulator YiaG